MTKKIILALFILTMVLATSCMQRPLRPKKTRANSTNSMSMEEDTIKITLEDGKTVDIDVDTEDFWKDNEELIKIYYPRIAGNYIYDGTPGSDSGLRYKFDNDLNMVDPQNPKKIYKKYIKTVVVKVYDKIDGSQQYDLHGKYVAGGVYKIVAERGRDNNGYDENTEKNQPKVGSYEIVINNYGRTEKNVRPPYSSTPTKLSILYRYSLPASDTDSSYDPEKVFNGTYPRIGDDDDIAYWYILPEKYTKR